MKRRISHAALQLALPASLFAPEPAKSNIVYILAATIVNAETLPWLSPRPVSDEVVDLLPLAQRIMIKSTIKITNLVQAGVVLKLAPFGSGVAAVRKGRNGGQTAGRSQEVFRASRSS